GFAGEAFVTPVFQGGTSLTLLAFMLLQDPVLGRAALMMLPIQLAVIPPLQRKINELNRARVREVRHLGGLLGESQPSAETRLRHLQRCLRAFATFRSSEVAGFFWTAVRF
ncbi:MAG: hypothetical protein WAS73_00265, partial [Defluviicoccus sp.]